MYYIKQPKTYSKRTLYLCCLFLGFAGIHRLLTGYKSWILQFLTLGGLGIWAMVDLLKIALGSFQYADGSPMDEPSNVSK
ncbi:MAG: TM2 domain-containing protein [Cytophagaceae bacterium]|nr:TM2 domain-containing protein [Cytophagaceae bacterium]